MQLDLWVSIFILLAVSRSEANIKCYTCTSKPGQPSWCTRGENKGTVRSCQGDSLHPANTCYKSVHKKTGAVNKGCAPTSYNHNVVQKIDTDFQGNKSVNTWLCNTNYCNHGATVVPTLGILTFILVTFLL